MLKRHTQLVMKAQGVFIAALHFSGRDRQGVFMQLHSRRVSIYATRSLISSGVRSVA
ncbi:MAG: hypothetical protein OHK0023_03500 [Anaerolineae bacterium]